MRVVKNIDTFIRTNHEGNVCVPKGLFLVICQDQKGNRQIMSGTGQIWWITSHELGTTFFDPPTDDEIRQFTMLMTHNLLLDSVKTH